VQAGRHHAGREQGHPWCALAADRHRKGDVSAEGYRSGLDPKRELTRTGGTSLCAMGCPTASSRKWPSRPRTCDICHSVIDAVFDSPSFAIPGLATSASDGQRHCPHRGSQPMSAVHSALRTGPARALRCSMPGTLIPRLSERAPKLNGLQGRGRQGIRDFPNFPQGAE